MLTGGYRGLLGITGGNKRVQGVAWGYGGLQGITRVYRGLQGVTRGAPGVRGDYNRKLGNHTGLTQGKLISFNRICRKLVFTIKMKNVSNPWRVIYILGKNLQNAGNFTMFVK